MRQSRKSIDHCDIVIVCEGSTTEYNYFCEIRDYLNMLAIKKSPYTHILIIPGDTDPIIAKSGRPLRKMNPDASQWRYYIMSEENETDYRQYCAQPIRYVREAELFLKYRNYDEAWAVL